MNLNALDVALMRRFEERYELRRKLWLDGPYEPWLAFDRLLEREVEIVLDLWRARSDNPFRIELRFLAQHQHPSLKPILDVGVMDGDRLYFATTWIEGETLDHWFRASGDRPWTLDIARMVEVLQKACRCLAFVHRQGTLHLSLDPGCLLIDAVTSELFLTEWYASKSRSDLKGESPDAISPQDELDVRIFKLGFAAFEQVFDPSRIGPVTDVHGLGGILFMALYGEPPNGSHQARRGLDRLEALRQREPGTLRSGLHTWGQVCSSKALRALESIGMQAVALDPGDRYPDMGSFGSALDDWLVDLKTSARKPRDS